MPVFAYFLVVGGTLVGLFFVGAGIPGPTPRSQFITTDMLRIVEPDHPQVKKGVGPQALNAFAFVPSSEKVLDGRAARETQRSQDMLQVGRSGSRRHGNSGDRRHLEHRNPVQRQTARENTW
jgi:hypothetical protein